MAKSKHYETLQDKTHTHTYEVSQFSFSPTPKLKRKRLSASQALLIISRQHLEDDLITRLFLLAYHCHM